MTTTRKAAAAAKTTNADMITYAIKSWSRSLRLCMIILASAGGACLIGHACA